MKAICFISFCLCFSVNLFAQQANTSGGGNASGSGGTSSFSVGQINYTTNSGTGGTVSQGVQQPFEIYTLSGIDDAKDLSINLTAFPNPTVDYLTLSFESTSTKKLSYQLFDSNGKLVISQNLMEQKQKFR